DLHNFAAAEKEYAEALEIRRALSKNNPEAYRPDVAMTLNNLGVLHRDLHDFAIAKKEYAEALKIRRDLYFQAPLRFGEDLCCTAFFYGQMLVDEKMDADKGGRLIKEAHQIATENKEQGWAKEYIDSSEDLRRRKQ
ncbi:MAG: tetratricopeptide repeat protein, partial [Candidatus Azobacteroides sp.]|nr:tetratricopeptide repeat protein [Candidatus Azobacteroides sp.]